MAQIQIELEIFSSDLFCKPIMNNNGVNNVITNSRRKRESELLENSKKLRALFSDDTRCMSWSGRHWELGTILHSLQESQCINSTLQAVFHVPSFAKWLLSPPELKHSQLCNYTVKCMTCCMRSILISVQSAEYPASPHLIYSNLKFDEKFKRKENNTAAKFLRHLLTTLDECYKSRYGKYFGNSIARTENYTTPVKQLFYGKIIVVSTCADCLRESTVTEPFHTITLNIKRSVFVESALEDYFDKKYTFDHCETCGGLVSTTVISKVDVAPTVLCVALQQTYNPKSIIINKHLKLTAGLDLEKYMNIRKKYRCYEYKLVSAVIREGGHSNKATHATLAAVNSNFFRIDNRSITPISESEAFETKTSLLFYERVERRMIQHSAVFF